MALAETPKPPPPARRWLYYMLGLTPPERYADWVRRDIEGRAWPWRSMIPVAFGVILGQVAVKVLLDASWTALLGVGVGVVAGVLLGGAIRGRYYRRKAINYYEKRWARARSA